MDEAKRATPRDAVVTLFGALVGVLFARLQELSDPSPANFAHSIVTCVMVMCVGLTLTEAVDAHKEGDINKCVINIVVFIFSIFGIFGWEIIILINDGLKNATDATIGNIYTKGVATILLCATCFGRAALIRQ